jgi:hypothetical protein
MDWSLTIRQIEDYLCPKLKLDAWEKSLYYHLLRRTRAAGLGAVAVAILPLAKATGMSEFKVRDAIRSLNAKNCVSIESRSRDGHIVSVRLPQEIGGVVPPQRPLLAVDIESIDFYNDRRYRDSLLDRERGRCFYSLKEIAGDSAVLDHVNPVVNGGNNSYRNIVVASHEMNALKQGQAAEDFVRKLYRSGVLSIEEMEGRLKAISDLKAGMLIPDISRCGDLE